MFNGNKTLYHKSNYRVQSERRNKKKIKKQRNINAIKN